MSKPDKKYYKVPELAMNNVGILEPYRPDVSFASVRLKDGSVFEHILVHRPNYIIAMVKEDKIPFDPDEIEVIYQSETDLNLRSRHPSTLWPHPWDGN